MDLLAGLCDVSWIGKMSSVQAQVWLQTLDIKFPLHCIADDLVCKNVVFLICGYDQAQMNETMVSTIASHIPAGTSAFTIVHYGQEYKQREQSQTLLKISFAGFRWFLEDYYFGGMDWGNKNDNMAHHGTEEPPVYNPNNINTKVENLWFSF